jgi:hypothetical protein
MYKANKRILRSLSFDNNGFMWPYGLIFSEYCNFFYILLGKLEFLIFLVNFIGEFEVI